MFFLYLFSKIPYKNGISHIKSNTQYSWQFKKNPNLNLINYKFNIWPGWTTILTTYKITKKEKTLKTFLMIWVWARKTTYLKCPKRTPLSLSLTAQGKLMSPLKVKKTHNLRWSSTGIRISCKEKLSPMREMRSGSFCTTSITKTVATLRTFTLSTNWVCHRLLQSSKPTICTRPFKHSLAGSQTIRQQCSMFFGPTVTKSRKWLMQSTT